MAAVCGLLAPGGPVLADDDLKIEGKSFRCYDGTSDSYYAMFAKYSAPSPTNLYAAYSIVARERGSDGLVPVTAGVFDQSIPWLAAFDGIRGARYRSMRASIVGTDESTAQTAESRSDENCKVLGDDDDGVKVRLHVLCARSTSGYRAHAVADIINHETTATAATVSFKLFGRRSGSDFQELWNQQFVQNMNGLSANFQHAADTENDLRRVRAEVELQVMGSNDTISEREEADCD
jgi:hypothetical protein